MQTHPNVWGEPLPSPAGCHAVAILQSRVNVLCSSTLDSRENERHHFCQFFWYVFSLKKGSFPYRFYTSILDRFSVDFWSISNPSNPWFSCSRRGETRFFTKSAFSHLSQNVVKIRSIWGSKNRSKQQSKCNKIVREITLLFDIDFCRFDVRKSHRNATLEIYTNCTFFSFFIKFSI